MSMTNTSTTIQKARSRARTSRMTRLSVAERLYGQVGSKDWGVRDVTR